MTYLQLAGGVIYLLMGGDLLVRGAVALARKAQVSPMIVALTIVAFGTSLPELVVAIQAALTGYPGIVLGNVVGSNIANVMLVGGATALIHPLPSGASDLRRNAMIMIGVSVLFLGISIPGSLHRLAGLLLAGGLIVVLTGTAREASRIHKRTDSTTPIEWVLGLPSQRRMITVFILAGLVGLPLGARLVVDAAVDIATQFGMSTQVVGLTVVAISTSLPELATTVVAAWQRRTDLVMGTMIGSNIFNIVGIMAVAAIVSPTAILVPDKFLFVDLPLMLGASVVLTAFVWLERPIRRWHGGALVAAYAVYIASLFVDI